MYRRDFFQGISAGVLAAAAGIIYSHVYAFANASDFSALVNPASISGLNIAAGMLIAAMHGLMFKWIKKHAELIFNLSLIIISFGLIVIPISISLPLNILSPELFPGLVIPMLFFPAIAWFTIAPFFNQKQV